METLSVLRIEVPHPPSINHYWRRVGPRTLISKGGRLFRRDVCRLLRDMDVRPIAGPLSVDVLIHPPDRRRRDIDNVLKALLDALQHGGAYEDDNQIVDLSIHKRCPIKGGKAIVQIEKADGRLCPQLSPRKKGVSEV